MHGGCRGRVYSPSLEYIRVSSLSSTGVAEVSTPTESLSYAMSGSLDVSV